MSNPLHDTMAGCRYGLAALWVATGARCEVFIHLEQLAARVEALRRGRALGDWREGRLAWGDKPETARRKIEVDVLQGDGKVALVLTLLVQGEGLDSVREAVAAQADPGAVPRHAILATNQDAA